jgi:hypothetical protein
VRGHLDDVPGKPLLGVDAEREQTRDGGLAAGEYDARAAQELGVVVEPAQPAGVAFADSVEEGIDQLRIEIVELCVFDR